jgi:hypothetical protein
LAQFNATTPYTHFPQISFSEFDTLGNWGDHAAAGNALSMIPSVTWNRGRHTIHAGLDWRILQAGVNANQDGIMFSTDRTWSQSNYIPSLWDAASGNSFASWLLGTATNGSFYVNATSFSSQHYYAPFFQDDWKVSRKLTLNLGVRWDLNGPKVERHNRWNGPFQFDVDNPVNKDPNLILADLPAGATLKGGISFLGKDGNIRSLYHLNKGDIQPRVGFAYAYNDKTLIRGGIGEMFENPAFWGNMLGYSSQTNYPLGAAAPNGYSGEFIFMRSGRGQAWKIQLAPVFPLRITLGAPSAASEVQSVDRVRESVLYGESEGQWSSWFRAV